MKNEKKTFWPYGILLSIIACIVACGYTIYVCLDYPVYVDNSKFASYQEVDYKINEIDEAQDAFETEFGKGEFLLFANGYEVKEEMKLRKKRVVKVADSNASFELLLKTKANTGKIDAFITRPDTSEYDAPFVLKFAANGLISEPFKVSKKGRWQIKIKIDSSDENSTKIGIYSYEFFAR